MTNPIKIIATLTTSNEAKEAVRKAMVPLVPASRSEDGCIRYDLFEVDPDGFNGIPNTGGSFVVIEEWQSEAVLKAHGASDHFQKFATAFSPDEMKVTVQVLKTA